MAKRKKRIKKTAKKKSRKLIKKARVAKKVLVRKKKIAKKKTAKKRKKVASKKRRIIKAKRIKKAKKISSKKPVKNKRKTRKKKQIVRPKAKKKPIKKSKKKIRALKKKPVSIKKKPIKAKKLVKKTRVIRISKKPVKKEASPQIFEKTFFKTRIKVIGIGGGGGSIVSEIGRSVGKANFVIADTDFRALRKRSGIKHFWFGKDFTHGLGSGVNPELAKRAAEAEKEKIADLFRDQNIVVLIASLGGGLGSGATQVFAEVAKSFGAITFGIFTLPFKFEGKNKSRIAQKALHDLSQFLNVSIVIPNEKIFKLIDTNTPITEAFSKVNKNLIESLESLIDLIYNPGLINIDFADLRAILSGSGNSAFLNTMQAFGKDRATETAEKILFNPLYQSSGFAAENILFNILGGSDLNMLEVQKISNAIAQLNPGAKIIFGISRDAGSRGSQRSRIKTTILATGPSKTAKKPAKKTAEKKEKPPQEKIARVSNKKQKKSQVKGQKPKVKNKKIPLKGKKEKSVKAPSFVPIFEKQAEPVGAASKLSVATSGETQQKKNIRRTALEIKKAEALEQDKRLIQEEEWEIPAFLRKVKFKS